MQREDCNGCLSFRNGPEPPNSLAAVTPTPALLAVEFDIGVTHAIVSSECVCPAECLFVGAQVAAHLLLARIVNRIFMPCQVVGPREDGIAGLASTRVDAVAPVWAGLAVEEARRHACANAVSPTRSAEAMGLSVAFPLVLLK